VSSRGNANSCASAGWLRWNAVSKQATCGTLGGNRADCTDNGDVMRLVQRGERYQSFERGQDLAVDLHRLRKSGPAVDNTVTHAVETGIAADMGCEPIMDGGYTAGIAVARNRSIGKLVAGRIGDLQMRRCPDTLDLAMSACRKGPVGHRLEYRELDAGTTPALTTRIGSRIAVTL